MYSLFSNTGIQFYELPWALPEHIIENEFGSELKRFLSNSWTLLSLDGSVRDYARLFWRVEDASAQGAQLRPILAIDTKTDDSPNGAFLRTRDGGLAFRSKAIENVLPENAEKLHKNWINRICNEKKIEPDGIFDFYKQLLQNVINGNLIGSISSLNEDIVRYGYLGGFDFELLDDERLSIDTNLYIDLGNSRSSAVLYEDNALTDAGFNTFHKLELLNYKEFFGFIRKTNVAKHESVFPSLIQFRKSPIPTDESTETFKLISITAIGQEARLYKTSEDIKPVSSFTGLSSPKRYLWDYEPFAANWLFANVPGTQIGGEILKFISLDDSDEDQEQALERPIDTNFPRRTMVTHFFVELIEQAIRSINSYNHRKNALPEQPRKLKRIVISYPSAFSSELSSRLLKQVHKAVRIIKEHYTVAEDISVDLGIDEATTVQCVFIQNQIYHSEIKIYKKLISHQSYHSNKDKLRIASIDIGGGTTDVMVSEYDLTDVGEGAPLQGKILFTDGIQYGGDEILRKLINNLIINSISESFEDKEVMSRIREILLGVSSETKHLRLGLINFLFYPLAIYLLNKATPVVNEQKISDQENLLTDICNKTIYEITQEILPETGSNNLVSIVPSFIETLNVHQPQLGERFFNGGNIHLTITLDQVKTQINDSALVKIYLNTYSTVLSHYSPSFVLLAGKLSELDIISDSLRNSMCFSPERILPISKIKMGQWYPYRIGNRMEDAKTTVCVGLAIADITRYARNTNGLAVRIVQNGSDDNIISYYYKQNTGLSFSPDDLLVGKNDSTSKTLQLHGNKYFIFGSRLQIHDNPPTSNFGSLHYELNLRGKIMADEDSPPIVRLRRTPMGLQVDQESISGNIINQDGKSVKCSHEHIRLIPKNIHEDFYLDSGRLA